MPKEVQFSGREKFTIILIIVLGLGLLLVSVLSDWKLFLLVMEIIAVLCCLMELIRRVLPDSKIAKFLTGVLEFVREIFGNLLLFA